MIDRVRVEERIRRSAAYWWAIARAVVALLGPGVVAEARRQLWQVVRFRPDLKRYAGRLWRPSWWYPLLYRRPVAAAGIASVLFPAILLALGLVVASALQSPSVVAPSREQLGKAIRFAERLDLQSLFLAVAGLQATFLAAVAPVAVALVSLLTGQRLRRRERIELFIADTEITAAATFWLVLLALSLLASVTLPSLNPPCAFAIGFAVFFFALWNVWVLGVFLLRAVAFIRPAGEDEALRRQLVRRYWLAEAAPKLAANTLINLRDPTGHAPFEDGPDTVLLDREKRRAFRGRTVMALSAPSAIRDIHDKTILAVIDAVRARNERADNPAKITFVVWGAHDLALGASIEGERILAAHTRRLTRLDTWLVRRSFRFSPDTAPRSFLTGERLLQEHVTDARDDLFRDDSSLCERLDRIAELHGFLLRLSTVREDDGESRNLATELAGSWFGSLADTWARTALPLYEAVAEGLPRTRRGFAAVARLPQRIAYAAGRSVPVAALQASDGFLAYLGNRVFDRGAAEAQALSPERGVARGPMPLPAAAVDWYDEAWRTLSAAWTDLLADRLIATGRAASRLPPDRAWAAWQAASGPLRRHLESTTRFVAKAAALGDAIGGGRTLDLLLAWPHEIDLRVGFGREIPLIAYPDADLGVSPTLLHRSDWAEVEKTVTAPPPDFLRQLQPARVVETALLNTWRDGCLALAVVLAEFALQAGPNSVAARLLRNLCRGAFHDPHPTPSAAASPAALQPLRPDIVLRTVAAIVSRRDEARGGLIEELLQRLREAAEPPMVSGRVYSGWGLSDRLDDTHQGLALLLLALALVRAERHQGPTTTERFGLAEAGPTDEGVATFLTKVAAATTAPSDELLRTLAGTEDVETTSLAKARQCVRVTCRLLARRLRRRTERVRKTAPLDPARLDAIAQAAGSLAFRKDTAAPPVSLFQAIAHAPNEQEQAIVVPASFRRGELTTPLLDTPSLNEADFWAQAMRDEVALAVLRVLLSSISRRRLASPEAWRDALIAWRQPIGREEPLLLWGRNWPTAWTLDRGVGSAIAARLNNPSPPPDILVRTPFLDGVRIVPVVRGAPTLLAPASMFRRLTFGAPEGKLVTLQVEDRRDAEDLVRLTLRASFSLDLDRPERALILDAIAADAA